MSEVRKGFYDHLQDVPNAHPDGEIKGTLDEFNRHAATMASEALRRTGVEQVEDDVRQPDETRIQEIEQALKDPEQGEMR